jgi:hypothetical protein
MDLKHKSLKQLQKLRQNPRYREQWDEIDITIEKLEQKRRDIELRPAPDDDIDYGNNEV